MSADRNTTSEAEQAQHFTREGDDGLTPFGDVGDVPKHDVRLAAYAECEEANAAVGVALALSEGLAVDIVQTLASVQHDLFDLAADLMTPAHERGDEGAQISQTHIERLERAVAHYGADLPRAKGFVLPGGTAPAALIFQARTVVRRAERAVWTARERYRDTISSLTAQYLNRLSALLFVLARAANSEHGDTTWQPMASVIPATEADMVGAEATAHG